MANRKINAENINNSGTGGKPVLGEGLKAFNINSIIMVKLKAEGYARWKEEDGRWLPIQYQKTIEEYKSRADSNGWIEFQCWEFMRLFGSTSPCSRSRGDAGHFSKVVFHLRRSTLGIDVSTTNFSTFE